MTGTQRANLLELIKKVEALPDGQRFQMQSGKDCVLGVLGLATRFNQIRETYGFDVAAALGFARANEHSEGSWMAMMAKFHPRHSTVNDYGGFMEQFWVEKADILTTLRALEAIERNKTFMHMQAKIRINQLIERM